MAPRTIYANLADGLQPFTLWDASLADMGSLGIIPCTASGSATIALTPIVNAFAPTPSYANNNQFSFIATATSTGPVTINVNGLGALNAYGEDGITRIAAGDLVLGRAYQIIYSAALNSNAGGFYMPGAGTGAGSFRQRLTADTTYYVRKDGSNSNNGLADTAAGAFLTIQKAINWVADNLDLNSFAVTIQVRVGTYAENIQLRQYIGRGTQGHTTPVIQGESADHTLVKIAPASSTGVLGVSMNYCEWTLKNLEVDATAAIGILSDAGSWICIDGVVFGGTATVHMEAEDAGVLEIVGNYTIATGAGLHVVSILDGLVFYTGNTVTLTGTPAFSTAFAYVDYEGGIQAAGVTFSGPATGTRFIQDHGGYFHTAGVNPNSVFPGNVNGAFTPWPVLQGGTGSTTSTGSGSVVLATSPTLVTPAMSSPNITGHPLIEGVTSTGATGTGNFVFDNTPTLITPVLGVATATSINKVALTAPATAATLTILNNKTATFNNSITIAGTDATTMTFPATSQKVLTTAGATFTATASNPTGTTSLTGVMMGLGSTLTITPVFSTRVMFQIGGGIATNTATDGGLGKLTFGTGTAPVNGAAPTGTATNNFAVVTATVNTAYPFFVTGIATGLSPGTAYWFDITLQALTGGTATITNPFGVAYEI